LVTDWDLTATGPSTITGKTGDTAITDAPVTAGSYTLSETGPAGYAPGAWSCAGGTVSGSVVTVPVGADITCTINNNDNPPPLPATGGAPTLGVVMPGLGLIVIGLALLMMRARRRQET